MAEIIDKAFAELTAGRFHDLLRLRVDVFVVEQECAYEELDGLDTDPGTRHTWIDGDNGPVAYLRLLDEGHARRIGRVVTRPSDRGAGLAARLVSHAIDRYPGEMVLAAQSHLVGWYEAFGFESNGPEFPCDGIPHVPMRRPASIDP